MITNQTSLQTIISDFREVFFLNSNSDSNASFLALGKTDEFVMHELHPDRWTEFQEWMDRVKDWKFGGISYDCKNLFEKLSSQHHDSIGLPHLHFLVPQVLVKRVGTQVSVIKNDSGFSDERFLNINWDLSVNQNSSTPSVQLQPCISREQYLSAVSELQRHIHRGDIYEANYCQEFRANFELRDPFATWCKLNELTKAPFSCFVKLGKRFVLCASPERFLKKSEHTIISQPIKGTIRRGKDEQEDLMLKERLRSDKKERSENVMIVDLVRNDLSKHARKDTVKVTELFGVHSFKTVHHMISTIEAELKPETTFTRIISDTFPMGSMTGAPKIRAMELIEEHERCYRGWYSGSVGYITPSGDFDLNVVIRSIFYNDETSRISVFAGGAITALSVPENEYHECLLKADAMMKALG